MVHRTGSAKPVIERTVSIPLRSNREVLEYEQYQPGILSVPNTIDVEFGAESSDG